jgi:hypothetical protein
VKADISVRATRGDGHLSAIDAKRFETVI